MVVQLTQMVISMDELTSVSMNQLLNAMHLKL